MIWTILYVFQRMMMYGLHIISKTRTKRLLTFTIIKRRKAHAPPIAIFETRFFVFDIIYKNIDLLNIGSSNLLYMLD